VAQGESEQPGDAITAAADVFISYASKDEATAHFVLESLEQAGVSCWIAPRDITPGAHYSGEIVRAIDAAKAIVLILSAASATSPHVLREIERAASKSHPIVSLRLDKTALSAEFQYFLNTSQWLDAPDGQISGGLPKFVAAVRQALRSRLPNATGSAASAPRYRDPPRYSRRLFAISALCVAAVAIVGFAAERVWVLSHRPGEPPAPSNIGAASPTETGFLPPAHSVAVLPFVNMSGDAKQDYFSDGVSEELLNSLARLEQLRVTARTSSFAFKGENIDTKSIARKLNVAAILEGSVRRSGHRIRITAQLIDAVSGYNIWSQAFDRDVTDLLTVQVDVATSIAKQLEIKLIGNEVARIELGGTSNPEAYDAYLRGRQLQMKQSVDAADDRAALAAFDHALALDPRYALAYVGRAAVLGDIVTFTAKPSERLQLSVQAREAAEKAVDLAPEMGEAHMILATTFSYVLLDFGRALPEFAKALSLAPGSASVQRGFASFASLLGRFEVAARAARQAVSLDPQNISSLTTLGIVQLQSRHYEDSLTALKHAMTLDPHSQYIEFFISSALTASGQIDQALRLCEAPTTPLQEGARSRCLALVYHKLGRQAEAERELKKIQAIAGDGEALSYASIYAQWGDKDAALGWLKKAEQLRDPEFQVLRVAWELDPIRNEPEFKAIETRMKFPPANQDTL
jgi:TolB-like protein/tetratricopeptide (TPR) repeat protein